MLARKIEISHRTIIFTVVFLVALWLLYLIRDILLQFFVSTLLMIILNPFVTRLAKYKIPRAASIILVYLLVLGLVGISVAGVIPPLIEQSTTLIIRTPALVNQVGALGTFGEGLFNELISLIGSLPAGAARFSVSVLSNIVNVIAVLIFTFYLLLSRDKLDEQLGIYFSLKRKESIEKVLSLMEKRLGGWLRGQVALMLVVGLATYIGLLILNIPLALPLSILAGLLEIIPYLGPVASAIPAVLIGLGISPLVGLAVVALYFLIQQLENYILVPKVMHKIVGISPIITLLALAIGFRVAGIAGIVISVPVVVMLQVLAEEYVLGGKKTSKQ
jgi:predicted PurR-regulated permease PerM